MTPQNKCVFLDRDGVLNEDCQEYVYDLKNLIIPEGVPEALQMLKKAGYLLIVVTNQAGIARGLYTAEAVRAVHQAMQEVSQNSLDDLYFAPGHPDYTGASLSRKPGSLMLERAAAKYNINFDRSWMIGDRDRDVEAGKNVGCRTIQIIADDEKSVGEFSAPNLLEAAKIILKSAD
jgi:D-glycero-D-manno-heptose 1,7-bisphosphate phosphatase